MAENNYCSRHLNCPGCYLKITPKNRPKTSKSPTVCELHKNCKICMKQQIEHKMNKISFPIFSKKMKKLKDQMNSLPTVRGICFLHIQYNYILILWIFKKKLGHIPKEIRFLIWETIGLSKMKLFFLNLKFPKTYPVKPKKEITYFFEKY
jgi:hypothetical protein